jgi:hypothetical protein
MPPTDSKAWIDHTKAVSLGAEILSQHYATVTLIPQGNGKYSFDMRCENGQRGSRTDGTWTLTLAGTSGVLKTVTQYCKIERGEFETSHKVTNYHQDLDLSAVIEQVTDVGFSVKGTWYPPRATRPPQQQPVLGDPYRQPGQPVGQN